MSVCTSIVYMQNNSLCQYAPLCFTCIIVIIYIRIHHYNWPTKYEKGLSGDACCFFFVSQVKRCVRGVNQPPQIRTDQWLPSSLFESHARWLLRQPTFLETIDGEISDFEVIVGNPGSVTAVYILCKNS